MRVLVIEDLPVNMLLVVAILERAGHIAIQAETATLGITLARETLPDAILMDIQLPDMDGLTATRLIKADPLLQSIPVIAVTAFAMKGDEQAVREAGCDGYVTKPIRYREFLAELEKVVDRHHMLRAEQRPDDGTVGQLPQPPSARTD
ncbi:MAG TPA: response regulator [Rhizobacter sp.]|nr:response regulator [Rhizobacter sp.]